jgi:hypothetical protein
MPPTIEVLAAATGSTGGLGKIGTVPASGVLYVRCPVSDKTGRVKWRVKADKAHSVQLYLAESIVQSVSLTLASLADGETLIINGLTYAGKAAGTTVASRFFDVSGDDTADAAALAAVINNAASGALGLTATSALGVVTVVPSASDGAYTIQAVTDTAAGHCAVASTTLAGLVRDGSPLTGVAADTTTAGYTIEQWNDGAIPYLRITNNDAVNAMTPVIKAARFVS